MTELHQSDELLSEAFRFLVDSGLPVQIAEAGDGFRFEIEGREIRADAIICGAFLLGMRDEPKRPVH
ncbi:hypothetical protein DK389_25250 [Methylobacterium durans]|uniref:Uncharacterized protein n=1 Tax=Methylobacterium durans TaxID=2202825 RepID=A0A2U8WAL8_9HYPH|nr:hypothetical protein DK389_25250 [Methylobacterium durans]